VGKHSDREAILDVLADVAGGRRRVHAGEPADVRPAAPATADAIGAPAAWRMSA
jgi:hypothetical protein